MQAIDIFLMLCCFFLYAAACGLLLNWVMIAMGSPRIEAQNSTAKAYCYTGKIFSFAGLFLAAKFNQYEQAKWQKAEAQIKQDIGALDNEKARQILGENIGQEIVKTMPIDRVKSNLYPLFREAYIPNWINPYSVLGLCLPCTAFWFGQIAAIPLFFCPIMNGWALVAAMLFLPPAVHKFAQIAST